MSEQCGVPLPTFVLYCQQSSSNCISQTLALWQVGFLLISCTEMLLQGMSVSDCWFSTKHSRNPSAWYHKTLPKAELQHIGISSHYKTENPVVFLQEGQVLDILE